MHSHTVGRLSMMAILEGAATLDVGLSHKIKSEETSVHRIVWFPASIVVTSGFSSKNTLVWVEAVLVKYRRDSPIVWIYIHQGVRDILGKINHVKLDVLMYVLFLWRCSVRVNIIPQT